MHLAQNRYFDQFAIDNHETGVSLRETLQDLFGMGDRGFIGRENPIKDWDWTAKFATLPATATGHLGNLG